MTVIELLEAHAVYERLLVFRAKLAQVHESWLVNFVDDRGTQRRYVDLSQAEVDAIIDPLIQARIDVAVARLTELGIVE